MPLPSILSTDGNDYMFTESHFRISLDFDYLEVMKKVEEARNSGGDVGKAGRLDSEKVPILQDSGHVSFKLNLDTADFVGIYFCSSIKGLICTYLQFDLRHEIGDLVKVKRMNCVRKFETTGGRGYQHFCTHAELQEYTADSKSGKHKLTLAGSITGAPSYCELPAAGADASTHPCISSCQNYLGLFLGLPFANDGLTDVSIYCEEKTFHAHRNVMCKRSDFFKACLISDHDTMEQVKGQIDIVDFAAADVEAFLVELYNPMNVKFYDMDCRTLIQVFKLVDKYLLHESTKLQYLSRIVAKLTKEHVVDALHATQTQNLDDNSDLVKKSFELVNAIPKNLWVEQKEKWTQYANENLDRMRKLVQVVIGEPCKPVGVADKIMEKLARISLALEGGAGSFDDKSCGDTVQLRSNDGVLLYTLRRVLEASGMFCNHEISRKTPRLEEKPKGEMEDPGSNLAEVAKTPDCGEETNTLAQKRSGTEWEGLMPDSGTVTDPKDEKKSDSHRENGTPDSGVEAHSKGEKSSAKQGEEVTPGSGKDATVKDENNSEKQGGEEEPASRVETQMQCEIRSGSRLDELAPYSGAKKAQCDEEMPGKVGDNGKSKSETQADRNERWGTGNEAEVETGPKCDKVCGALAAGFAEMNLPAHVLRRLLSCMYNLPAQGVMPTDLGAFKSVYDTLEAHGANREVYEACCDQMLAAMQVHPSGLAAWPAVQILEWANANHVRGLANTYFVSQGGKIEAKDLDDPKLAQMHGWLLVELAIACSSNEG